MKWAADSQGAPQRLCVAADATLLDALRTIDSGGEAIVFVCDVGGRVVGSLTDGDVRRAILKGASLEARCLPGTMRRDFVWVGPDTGRAEVLDLMRARQIGQIPVLDEQGRLIGIHTVGALLTPRERPHPVVIMAGGRGTRLYPLTETLPKPMLKVAGRPILERLILHLMGCGFRQFHIAVNYLAEVIEDHFGDGSRFGCAITYLREERPLGTGGPLSLLDPLPELPLVAVNGDLVTQCDVGGLLDFHTQGGHAATFGVRPYHVSVPFGVAEVSGTKLIRIREKPTEQLLINAGIYALSPSALRLVPRGEDYPITELFNRCIAEGMTVGAYLVEDDWIDVGRPDDLRRAQGDL